MPFSFLLQAYVPDSHKCCMSLQRAWGEERRGGERRRESREKEDSIGRGEEEERGTKV